MTYRPVTIREGDDYKKRSSDFWSRRMCTPDKMLATPMHGDEKGVWQYRSKD